jgi:hypothetical protein
MGNSVSIERDKTFLRIKFLVTNALPTLETAQFDGNSKNI